MKRARPKYQVFVSSTFEDLRIEREAVTWAILKLFFIPAGMEAFPASNDRGWDTIRRVIDDSDYYVLVLAGRYGTIDPDEGISWTHREYRYAVSQGIPVLAFIRDMKSITADKTERDRRASKKLQEFQAEVRRAHLCSSWGSTTELCQAVSEALTQRVRQDEYDSTPRPGWYRGDAIPGLESMDEFARLSSENARLRADLAEAAARGTVTLQLVSEQGPVAAELVERRKKLAIRDHELDAMLEEVDATEAEIRDYVSRLNRAVWVELSCQNLGTGTAKEVTIDFEASGIQDLYWVEVPAPKLHASDQVSEAEPDWLMDPSHHRYVDFYRPKGADGIWVRQRIRSITPGNSEPLTRFAVLLREGEGELECLLHYRIFHAGGRSMEGQCRVRLVHEDEEIIDLWEA